MYLLLYLYKEHVLVTSDYDYTVYIYSSLLFPNTVAAFMQNDSNGFAGLESVVLRATSHPARPYIY